MRLRAPHVEGGLDLQGVRHESEHDAAGVAALARRRREGVHSVHGHAEHAALLRQPRVLLPYLRMRWRVWEVSTRKTNMMDHRVQSLTWQATRPTDGLSSEHYCQLTVC